MQDRFSIPIPRTEAFGSATRSDLGAFGFDRSDVRDCGFGRLDDGYVFAMKCTANPYRFAMPPSALD
jgi:hypothetical protein